MTFDEWFAKEYGDKREQLGSVVPELMRAAYEAAERQSLVRAREVIDAEHLEGETDNPSDFAYQCAVDDCVTAIGALIEESASKTRAEQPGSGDAVVRGAGLQSASEHRNHGNEQRNSYD